MPTGTFAPTFAVTSCAWFLVTPDRLVVETALPTIRSDLGSAAATLAPTVDVLVAARAVQGSARRSSRPCH
jgi:hypothetical protein